MKKKYAISFALLITVIIAVNISFFSTQFSPVREKVKMSRVIDGDTVELEDGRRVRLLNINSPEKGKEGYEPAVNFLKNYEDDYVEIEIVGTDKYNRFLARIFAPGYLNLELVKMGFAIKFLVDKSEIKEFAGAEKEAITNEKGIWKKSDYFGCFDADINYKEEKVKIENKCNKINVAGWVLRDESRKYYIFGDMEIGYLIVNSEKGKDSTRELFWNLESDVWNNDRDTLYLFDKEGRLVYYESYGY